MKGRVAAVLLLLAVAGCSSSNGDSGAKDDRSADGSGANVQLKLLAFGPADLRVPVGTTVSWRNAEPITHTVTSGAVTDVDPGSGLRGGQEPDGRFDHRLAKKGDSFSYRFTEPGTYSYYCSIHKGMNATVEVTS